MLGINFPINDPGGASQFGWVVGLASGLIIDVLIIALVAMAPSLAAGAEQAARQRRRRRTPILWTIPVIGFLVFVGGMALGRALCVFYAQAVAEAAAATVFVIVALSMFTAANQVASRGVR
jgi:hypothetical protein